MDTSCATVIPSIGMGVLFIISEMLPFVSKVQANGLLEGTILYLKSKRKQKERLPDPESPEENNNQEEETLLTQI